MIHIKQDSSRWINQRGFVKEKFLWKAGYGAFSYSRSQLPRATQYIRNQEKHHVKKSFSEEYLELLKMHKVDFSERYVFEPIRLPYLTARSF